MDDASTSPSIGLNAAETLTRALDGYLVTQQLRVAARLGVADALAGGPMSGPQLAAAVGADPSRLSRVMRGLILEGVFAEDDAGRFLLTPVGELLRGGVPGSLRDLAVVRAELNYRAAERLLDGVVGGATPFERVYGQAFFDHLEHNTEHGAMFHAAMAARASHEAQQVVDAYDFAGLRKVVDVGGGRGVLLRAILIAAPGTVGVLVDTPAVIEEARVAFAGTGFAERVELVAGDFFATLPTDGDAYVLSRVLHDWDDADARRILTACRSVMPGQSRLIVVEALMPQHPQDRPAAVRMDVSMLVLLNGRERQEHEYRALLRESGYTVTRVLPTDSALGVTVIEAIPEQ